MKTKQDIRTDIGIPDEQPNADVEKLSLLERIADTLDKIEQNTRKV